MTKKDLPTLANPEDVDDWLDDFDLAMLERECVDDALVVRCMEKGSAAKQWFEGLDEKDKISFDTLSKAIGKFRKDTGDQKH
ncbi:hypothetical protein QFC21_007257 [Naganishia friedmannii]|uniref:Uncharacterized protein n=1 Tax=Naganishia friedmannii TaxID=89922 RepID=A0ACC2UWZ4_9TREE|nr:hypothetical protein QFC21_007257 [Naganishia friedmannii]